LGGSEKAFREKKMRNKKTGVGSQNAKKKKIDNLPKKEWFVYHSSGSGPDRVIEGKRIIVGGGTNVKQELTPLETENFRVGPEENKRIVKGSLKTKGV